MRGRFKSCLVDSDYHLLTAQRYIELNPVRAAMMTSPEQYRWSSVRTGLATEVDPMLTAHPAYLALAADRAGRVAAYGDWLRQGITAKQVQSIRLHLKREGALGNLRFQAMVEKTLNRPVGARARGRPRQQSHVLVDHDR